MDNLRILYLYSRFVPLDQSKSIKYYGGAQKRVSQMAFYFKTKGYRVYIGSDDEDCSIIDEFNINGIVHIKIGFRQNFLSKIFSLFALFQFVKKNKIDVIHCNDRISAIFCRFVTLFSKAKMIYTARAIYTNKRLSRFFFGNKIIAISEAVKNNLIEYFHIKPQRVSVIYNGTGVVHIDEKIIQEKKVEFGLKKKDRIISAIGRLTEVKGYSFLIKAIYKVKEKFPTVRLLIVGDGEMRNELSILATSLGLKENVLFIGNQENVDVFYAISEFTVLPSLSEGLGVSAIESLLHSKPVIATKVGGLPEVIKNNLSGFLIPPRDIESLVDAIIVLFTNVLAAERMGSYGKSYAIEKFSLVTMFENYETLYKALKP